MLRTPGDKQIVPGKGLEQTNFTILIFPESV